MLSANHIDGPGSIHPKQARTPSPDPIGVKGLGELVIVGVPAAIANAVFNATGKRMTDLPIRLENLL
jgi:xanthine dehydrogenase YagR molybdenum-binding subunit